MIAGGRAQCTRPHAARRPQYYANVMRESGETRHAPESSRTRPGRARARVVDSARAPVASRRADRTGGPTRCTAETPPGGAERARRAREPLSRAHVHSSPLPPVPALRRASVRGDAQHSFFPRSFDCTDRVSARGTQRGAEPFQRRHSSLCRRACRHPKAPDGMLHVWVLSYAPITTTSGPSLSKAIPLKPDGSQRPRRVLVARQSSPT